MSDFLKIVIFSLILSVLWVIPRYDIIIQWATHNVWLATGIAVVLIVSLLLYNFTKQKLIQKRLTVQEEQLKVKKTESP
ncbi:hypothetical protein ACFFHM_17935 [Halalkalibacter kiskunsagensis]|uniref:Uncharacterized protein n=1 Tax=Halalkalibacter kiskunsagensis TaxID=1548599 RepID=A0ABV6KG67_9BACI